MTAKHNDTIFKIKRKIQQKAGVPVHQQRLLFQGIDLKNSHSLAHYGIENMSTLRLVTIIQLLQNIHTLKSRDKYVITQLLDLIILLLFSVTLLMVMISGMRKPSNDRSIILLVLCATSILLLGISSACRRTFCDGSNTSSVSAADHKYTIYIWFNRIREMIFSLLIVWKSFSTESVEVDNIVVSILCYVFSGMLLVVDLICKVRIIFQHQNSDDILQKELIDMSIEITKLDTNHVYSEKGFRDLILAAEEYMKSEREQESLHLVIEEEKPF